MSGSDLPDAEADQEIKLALEYERLKAARLQSDFRKQLQGVLAEVCAEEEARRVLANDLQHAQKREAQLVSKLAALKAEHAAAISQLQDQLAALTDLQSTADAAAVAEAATAATVAAERAADAAARRCAERAAEAAKAEAARVREELVSAQQVAEKLLEQLAGRDDRVAELAGEAAAARAAAAAAAEQLVRMEGVLRATGERAAAAEAEAAGAWAALAACQREVATLSSPAEGKQDRRTPEASLDEPSPADAAASPPAAGSGLRPVQFADAATSRQSSIFSSRGGSGRRQVQEGSSSPVALGAAAATTIDAALNTSWRPSNDEVTVSAPVAATDTSTHAAAVAAVPGAQHQVVSSTAEHLLREEVATLRGLLAARDQRLRELEAQVLGGRTASDALIEPMRWGPAASSIPHDGPSCGGGVAAGLQEASLLALRADLEAAEAQRWELERDVQRQRAHRVLAASAVVERTAATTTTRIAADALQHWRVQALSSKVFALHEQLAAAQAEVDALRCAAEARGKALEAYLDRGAPASAVVGRARHDQQAAFARSAILLAWMRAAVQQQAVREGLAALADAALKATQAAERGGPGAETFVQRLQWRRQQHANCNRQGGGLSGGGVAATLAARQVASASLGAWRALGKLEAGRRALRGAQEQVEALSAGLPVWVQHLKAKLGDCRRTERAYLAWRLAACRVRRRQQPNAAAEAEAADSLQPQGAAGGEARQAAPMRAAAAAAGAKHASSRVSPEASYWSFTKAKHPVGSGAAFGRTLAPGGWKPQSAQQLTARAVTTAAHTSAVLPRPAQRPALTSAGDGQATAASLMNMHSPQRASAVCSQYLGIAGALQSVKCALTTQTRGLFSGGSDAVAATEDSVSAAAPLPLLGEVPGAEAAAHMVAVTGGLHSSARPYLRRSAADLAAEAGAAKAMAQLTAEYPQMAASSSAVAAEADLCASESRPLGQLEGSSAAVQAVQLQGHVRMQQHAQLVDARPPSVPPVLPISLSPALALTRLPASPPIPLPAPPAPPPVAIKAATGAAAVTWRVVGQPRETWVGGGVSSYGREEFAASGSRGGTGWVDYSGAVPVGALPTGRGSGWMASTEGGGSPTRHLLRPGSAAGHVPLTTYVRTHSPTPGPAAAGLPPGTAGVGGVVRFERLQRPSTAGN